MPDLTPLQWTLAFVAAASMGISKGGLAGLSLIHVIILAFLFGARDSTGIVLPMLIVGDICAVTALHQHARWDYVRRMLPPACIGIVIGAWLMRSVNESMFRPVTGWIILGLAVLQLARMLRPAWFGNVPHNRWFAWGMGLFAGITTMLANAAGPIFALYALAVALPKFEIVGTSAWFFFIINTFKVPFSLGLGLIHGQTLLLNLVLSPVIVAGVFGGRWIMNRIPQRLFDEFLLAFAAIAALRLIGPGRRVAKRVRLRIQGRLRSKLPAISPAGRRVSLQVRRGGHWYRVARARTKAGGTVVLRTKLRSGRYVMRVKYAGAPELESATSRSFVMKVPRRKRR